jgi:hypothetical protein
MKRKFLLGALLAHLALSATAQSAEFRYKGQPLADGATVVITAEENDFGILDCETNPPASPNDGLVLANLTGTDANGRATLTISSNTMAAAFLQWCMGGQCVMVAADKLDKEFVLPANGLIQVQFDAQPTEYGELEAQIKADVNFLPVTVNVRFVYADPAAVRTVTHVGNAGDSRVTDLYGHLWDARHLRKGFYLSNGRKFFNR